MNDDEEESSHATAELIAEKIRYNYDHISPWVRSWCKRDYSKQDAIEFLRQNRQEMESNNSNNSNTGCGTYFIFWNKTEFAGTVGITMKHSYDGGDDEGVPPEVGFWIDKDHVKKGIATLATQALIEEYCTEMKKKKEKMVVNSAGITSDTTTTTTTKLRLLAKETNVPSQRVATKLGFQFVGTTIDEGNTCHVYEKRILEF